jgi:hypothetical protein
VALAVHGCERLGAGADRSPCPGPASADGPLEPVRVLCTQQTVFSGFTLYGIYGLVVTELDKGVAVLSRSFQLALSMSSCFAKTRCILALSIYGRP